MTDSHHSTPPRAWRRFYPNQRSRNKAGLAILNRAPIPCQIASRTFSGDDVRTLTGGAGHCPDRPHRSGYGGFRTRRSQAGLRHPRPRRVVALRVRSRWELRKPCLFHAADTAQLHRGTADMPGPSQTRNECRVQRGWNIPITIPDYRPLAAARKAGQSVGCRGRHGSRLATGIGLMRGVSFAFFSSVTNRCQRRCGRRIYGGGYQLSLRHNRVRLQSPAMRRAQQQDGSPNWRAMDGQQWRLGIRYCRAAHHEGWLLERRYRRRLLVHSERMWRPQEQSLRALDRSPVGKNLVDPDDCHRC